MANLQGKTLTERMNDINGDGPHEFTFTEACNRYVRTNISWYSGIGYNKYTAKEAFNIMRGSMGDAGHGGGIEMLSTTNDRIFNGPNNWTVYDPTGAGCGISTSIGTLFVIPASAEPDKQGVQLKTQVMKGAFTSGPYGAKSDIRIGHTYRVMADIEVTDPVTGEWTFTMEFGGDSQQFKIFDVVDTSCTLDFHITDPSFTPSSTTSYLRIYEESTSLVAWRLDNVSVKRISVGEVEELVSEMAGLFGSHERTATESLNKVSVIIPA